jgi:hypothetical protein
VTPSPFSAIFQVGSQVSAQGLLQASILLPIASCIAGVTGVSYSAAYLLRWSLANSLPGLVLNYDSPDLCFLGSWEPPHQASYKIFLMDTKIPKYVLNILKI